MGKLDRIFAELDEWSIRKNEWHALLQKWWRECEEAELNKKKLPVMPPISTIEPQPDWPKILPVIDAIFEYLLLVEDSDPDEKISPYKANWRQDVFFWRKISCLWLHTNKDGSDWYGARLINLQAEIVDNSVESTDAVMYTLTGKSAGGKLLLAQVWSNGFLGIDKARYKWCLANGLAGADDCSGLWELKLTTKTAKYFDKQMLVDLLEASQKTAEVKAPPVKKARHRERNTKTELSWYKLRQLMVATFPHTCMMCGADARGNIHVDHVKPAITNPELSHDIRNLGLLCQGCNSIKGARHSYEYRDDKTLELLDALHRRIKQKGFILPKNAPPINETACEISYRKENYVN